MYLTVNEIKLKVNDCIRNGLLVIVDQNAHDVMAGCKCSYIKDFIIGKAFIQEACLLYLQSLSGSFAEE